MHAFATILFTAGLAAAQTVTLTAASAGFTCAAQNIVAACLGSTQPLLEACVPQDWDCMCTRANDVLTCYNNCPGDPDQFGAQQTKISYCNAAAAYGSSALASAAASTAGPSATAVKTEASVTAAPTEGSNVQQAAASSGPKASATAAPGTGSASSLNVKLPVVVGGGLLAVLLM